MLIDIISEHKLWISNIHLKAGVSTHEDIRINQINSTLKLIKDLDIPCCIIGDYNDDLKKYRKLYHLLYENGFNSNISPPSCYVPDWKGITKLWNFDHVFTKNKIKTEHINIPKCRPIPDQDNPSDHLMIQFIINI